MHGKHDQKVASNQEESKEERIERVNVASCHMFKLCEMQV